MLHANLAIAARRAYGAIPSIEARATFATLLDLFVEDSGPTPQPAVLSSGGIELQWLVGGRVVMAVIEVNGDYNLYGEAADGRVLFDVDVDYGNYPQDVDIASVRSELAVLARDVVARAEAFS